MNWTDEQLMDAGLDPKKVKSIVRRLNKLGKEMASMGLSMYGASGSGNLVHISRPTHIDSVRGSNADFESSVANIVGTWDGGDW